ncbi:M24 family metallopeptidase [Salibacterium aidingense]|uniref:M24 family metallopeptidase n=1 Tax=Salibacterium aidingense TaxID=384933 RepID=UPI0003F54901|nr:Xaa-Pro peptidase family protein [Salibacterium aidingense]
MFTDQHTPGVTQLQYEKSQINIARMRQYRLHRIKEQLRENGYPACLLFDAMNIRYATGTRNMEVYIRRNPGRYVFIPVEGPVILFDFDNCEHLFEGVETVDEIRPAYMLSYAAAGDNLNRDAGHFAAEITALMKQYAGGEKKLAVDQLPVSGHLALRRYGLETVDAQRPVEHAKAVKSEDEIEAVKISIKASEIGIRNMYEAAKPGMTENELWSILHQSNIAMGGDYIETRLLSSGRRTNPWFQECSDRTIQKGDMLSFDTDTCGPFGYYCDISRSFVVGDKPTKEQKRLYQTAYEQVMTNKALLKPGVSFREYAEKSWKIPKEFFANRYFCNAHGSGFTGEYPIIAHAEDFEQKGYDGEFVENMIICIESYIGAKNGTEGVKLEEQMLITKDGAAALSHFPYEEELLR